MMRGRSVLACLLLLASACGSDEPAPPSTAPATSAISASITTTTTEPATTTEPTTTTTAEPVTTTTTTVPVDLPTDLEYLEFGPNGLVRAADGIRTTLAAEPVSWADDDRMGGVVFQHPGDDTVYRLREGATSPVAITRTEGYWYPRFTGVIDGRPLLFFDGIPEGDHLRLDCGDWSLNARDLETGEEHAYLCLPIEDAGFDIASTGGGRFVGAPYSQCGATFTSTAIRFWDRSGKPLDVPANPQSADCAPCEVSALISPDGHQLAYLHRPDSFHPNSPHYHGEACGVWEGQGEAWWEASSHVPAAAAVIDLESGGELWRREVPAGTWLVDYDGRFVVLGHPRDDGSGANEIVDTWGLLEPTRVPLPQHVALVPSRLFESAIFTAP